jgi:hypothetical protein
MRPDLARTIAVVCSPVTPPKAAGWIEHTELRGKRSWARMTMRERMGSTMRERGIDWWVDMVGATAVSTAHAYLRWVGGIDTTRRGKAVFEEWQRTIPNSELAILPLDGYHAAATDPDLTAKTVLDFLGGHSR